MPGYDWNVDRFSSELTIVLESAVAGARNAAALARVVSESARAAEEVCAGRPMDCTAGCPHCCVLNVAILLPEGMVIADWLLERLSDSEIDILRRRLSRHRAWTRWMDDDERITKLAVCPLLDAAGKCTIHPVRPLVCRAVVSLDRSCCAEAFCPVVTDEERTIPADLMRQAAFDTAFSALGRVLKRHGFDDRSIELGSGVLAFLERPECRELILRGERLPGELWA
jgi:hypothetical protein